MQNRKVSDNGSAEPTTSETFVRLLGEWRGALTRAWEEAETFTREKPAAGLCSSFFVGFLFGRMFGRKK